jgi:hypothetical protein
MVSTITQTIISKRVYNRYNSKSTTTIITTKMGAINMSSTKKCIKCKEVKDLSKFHKANYAWQEDGYDYYCKFCRVGTAIKSHANNKRKCSLPECEKPHYAKTYCRVHYSRFIRLGTTEVKNQTVDVDGSYSASGRKIYTKESKIFKTYKMELSEYRERIAKGCELCGDKPERSLHIDHDHNCCSGTQTCGSCVRGIVCNGCNKAIDRYERGYMRSDNPKRDMVEEYLRKYSRKDSGTV